MTVILAILGWSGLIVLVIAAVVAILNALNMATNAPSAFSLAEIGALLFIAASTGCTASGIALTTVLAPFK